MFLEKKVRNRCLITQLFLTLSLAVSAQKISNLKPYFQTSSRLGLVIVTHSIEYVGQNGVPLGRFGAFTVKWKTKSGGKYDKALAAVEPTVDPTEKLKSLYSDLYQSKGKKIAAVNVNFDTTFSEFKKRSTGGENYFEKDIRFLGEKLHLDELLIVFVRYGLTMSSRLGIEISGGGFVSVDSQIINLHDNSIYMSQDSNSRSSLDGPWDSADYYFLKSCISEAIEKVIKKEKKKYEW